MERTRRYLGGSASLLAALSAVGVLQHIPRVERAFRREDEREGARVDHKKDRQSEARGSNALPRRSGLAMVWQHASVSLPSVSVKL